MVLDAEHNIHYYTDQFLQDEVRVCFVCVCVWPHHEVYGILVPCPGIKPRPLVSESAESTQLDQGTERLRFRIALVLMEFSIQSKWEPTEESDTGSAQWC